MVFEDGTAIALVSCMVAELTLTRIAVCKYNNQTDTYEHDYGSGTAGVLIRRTHTDYLTVNPVNGADYTLDSIHIRNLPKQTSVFDGDPGVERARTVIEYDNYLPQLNHTPKDCPNISGLDPTFTAGYTSRGNATKFTQYLLVNSSEVGSTSASAQYDIAGNVIKTVDAMGNSTELDFTDNFGAPDGEAQLNSAPDELGSVNQLSYAFAKKITNALGQSVFGQYDYYLGRPVDGEDLNGVVASGFYGDSLDRPTQLIRAANPGNPLRSQTSFAYDDVNRIITVTSDQTAVNDNVLKNQTLYDGLGRTIESRQYETSTQYIAASKYRFLRCKIPIPAPVLNPQRTGY